MYDYEHAGLYPLDTPLPDLSYITPSQLLEATKERLRLGFSQGLELEYVETLPAILNFPVTMAWKHVSTDKKTNCRLVVYVGTDISDLDRCLVDVSERMLEKIRENPPLKQSLPAYSVPFFGVLRGQYN